MPPKRVQIVGTVVKVAGGVAYGHAVVANYDGEDYFDLQGDNVDMDSLRDCATAFMQGTRTAKRMHKGGAAGQIVHSMPLDAEMAAAFGITTKKLGWLIGMLPGSEELAKEMADGLLPAFSIGGLGERVEIDADGTEKGLGFVSLAKDGSDKGQKGKRYRLRLKRLDEVSAVDRPAQEWATVALIKNADGTSTRPAPGRSVLIAKLAAPLLKSVFLTTATAGHQHRLSMCGYDDERMTSGDTSYESGGGARDFGHSHAWICGDDGKVTIAESHGHTHELGPEAAEIPTDEAEPAEPPTDPRVAVVARDPNAPPTIDPPSPEPAAMPMTPEELAKYNRALALAEMTDAQKAWLGKLPALAADAFVAKSAPEREAALAADAPVYTIRHGESAGTVLRKSDPTALVSACKMADASHDATVKAQGEAADSIAKAVALETIPYLAGTGDVHTAIIKSVTAIGDEALRKGAMDALKGANAAVQMLTKQAGFNGGAQPGAGGTSRAKLTEKARERAAKNGEDLAVAKAWLLEHDSEARALYDQIDKEDRAAQASARASA
jgi:hypothetical protein